MAEITVAIPEGFRPLAVGEFVPVSALYYSTDGSWRPTPSAGNEHRFFDGVIYIVPEGTGVYANPLPPGE
jgi:hypothetical protein